MRLPSILNAVHETPLVALPKLSARLDRHLFLKLESANPTGSMKDRVALHCIDKAIERKRIVPGDCRIHLRVSGNQPRHGGTPSWLPRDLCDRSQDDDGEPRLDAELWRRGDRGVGRGSVWKLSSGAA